MTSVSSADVQSRLDGPSSARGALCDSIRSLQNVVRGSHVMDDQAVRMAEVITALAREIADAGIDDELGVIEPSPGRKNTAQAWVPAYEVDEVRPGRMGGTITFPRACLGADGAVHGGAIALVADDVLGRLAATLGTRLARTAYLRLDYRRLTLVGQRLGFRASVREREGRKTLLGFTLSDGDLSLVDVQGLWITTVAE